MTSRRSALGGAVTLWLASTAVTAGGGLLMRACLPDLDATIRALLAVEVLFGISLAVAPLLAGWRQLGVNRPREWRDQFLLCLPLAVAISPLALGVRSLAAGELSVLVVGYALTGFTEELVWRGMALRLLAPLGRTRAVVVAAALFGSAHLANVFYRDSVALVLAQAWGGFCFGLAYGALRNRIGSIVPLMVLHAVTDLAAAIGALPKLPMLVGEDVVLLSVGVVLLARDRPPLSPSISPGVAGPLSSHNTHRERTPSWTS